MMSEYDINKVKEYYQFLTDNTSNYQEFVIALLIHERIGYIWRPDDIKQWVVDKVGELADRKDTIFDYYLNEDLDDIDREIEESLLEQTFED